MSVFASGQPVSLFRQYTRSTCFRGKRHNESRHRHFTPKAAAEQHTAGSLASTTATTHPRSAYIHLPFCKKKCLYCDFPVIAVGTRLDEHRVQEGMQNYVDAVCREITATRRFGEAQDGPLTTVFFGGGTPSLIAASQLELLLSVVDRRFGIASDAEISIEADPGTFTASTLRSYRSLGVTRVSVGVQAFDDELLRTCGRAHDLADVYRAIEAVHASEIPTWSLDLMSGLPGLREDRWNSGLEAALDAGAPHISVYDLQIEEETPFGRKYRPGVAPLPTDEAAAAMYATASGTLRSAGYEHYEVSNYAKKGHRCRHNMVYWEGGEYYGFGMGAASYLHGRRFSRPRRLNAYVKWLVELELEAAHAIEMQSDKPRMDGVRGEKVALTEDSQRSEVDGATPGSNERKESEEDRLTDRIMLRLRLADGLDLVELAGDFEKGDQIANVVVDALLPHVERGRVMLTYSSDSERRGPEKAIKAQLTDPEGFLVSNDVISDVFLALDEVKRA
jgi:putative oxygen-independent coproporphyrinogen III oxidase